MIGDFLNDLIFAKMKKKDPTEKVSAFAFRSILSSLCGELVDCVEIFFCPLSVFVVSKIKAYEKKRLKDLSNRSLLPQEKKEYSILKDLVSFTDEAEKSLQSMVELSYKKGTNIQLELAQIKTNYAQDKSSA